MVMRHPHERLEIWANPAVFRTMIAWPKRLIVFWVVTTTVSVLALIRGLSTEGEPRAISPILGLLGIAGFLLFLVGWVRQSRRRR
jgi:hypothetical protein